MKKINILYIIFVVFFNIAARMIQIWAMSAKNNHLILLFDVLIIVVLPSLYGAVSCFLIGRLPKALLMNGAALIAAAAAVAFCTKWFPLFEGIVIILQIPVLLIAYFAAWLIHTSRSRTYKLLVSILFCVILAGIAGVVHFMSSMLLLLDWNS